MQGLEESIKKIKNLDVQGATEITIFGMNEFIKFSERISHLEHVKQMEELENAEQILSNARKTVPGLRNGILYTMAQIKQNNNEIEGKSLSESIKFYSKKYIDLLTMSKMKIAKFASRLIPDNDPEFTILTHCHSSVVDAILFKAKEDGKKFRVIVTETRPLYQGRTTIKKLVEKGIKVIQVVDSAMRWAIVNLGVDVVIVGANAINGEGEVLNKIGSRLLALTAKESHISFYVATPLLKYSPGTLYGGNEAIEMRDPDELTADWKESEELKKIKDENNEPLFSSLNPAFEQVSRLLINGIITEAGIFPSGTVLQVFSQTYPIFFEIFEDLMRKNIMIRDV